MSEEYQASPAGREISCVFHGVQDEIINDPEKLKEELIKALESEDFTILGIADHRFQPQGYTCTIVLGESHLAIHTYPEFQSIAYQLYTCRSPTDGQKTTQAIINAWKPEKLERQDRILVVDPNFKTS